MSFVFDRMIKIDQILLIVDDSSIEMDRILKLHPNYQIPAIIEEETEEVSPNAEEPENNEFDPTLGMLRKSLDLIRKKVNMNEEQFVTTFEVP